MNHSLLKKTISVFKLTGNRLIGFLVFVAACSPVYKISNQNLSQVYDPGNNYLHPQYTVYHFREDSSRLFVKISADEVLYKKNDAGVVSAQLTLLYKLFSDLESKLVIDSGSVSLSDYNENNVNGYLVHFVNFKTPLAANYVLEVELKDNYRLLGVKSFLAVEKLSKQSAQNFLLKSPGQNVPLFRNYISGNESFNILTNEGVTRKMFVRCYFRNYPLAAPPFAEKIPLKFEYAADSIFTMDVSPSTEIKLERKGFYHFQYDTAMKPGLTIFRFDDDFPKMTDANQLLESLRFLTTKKEYDELSVAADKKAAIDSYWLTLAGNQQRARVLIRKYYTRIQDANMLFTSYLEGWKTDRGLIYSVFGPPTSVFKSNTAEDWTYGNFNYNNSLTFTFEKIYNPFADNDFVLRRSSFYENPWYRAVDRWREGVVIND